MSINVTEGQLPHQYEKYVVDMDRVKQKIEQIDKDNVAVTGNDTVDISKAGRNALEKKIYALGSAGQNKPAGKLSPVNSFSVMSDFERAVSAEKEEEVMSNTFDYHVNQMVSAYKRMRNGIEEKYADTDREQQYSVNNENIRLLSQSKEGLGNIKLDLGISKSVRNELNHIWDYYKAVAKGIVLK